MSHTYLLELYTLINQRLENIEQEKAVEPEAEHLRGRSESLEAFKKFLNSQYDNKLPLRLRGKYSG